MRTVDDVVAGSQIALACKFDAQTCEACAVILGEFESLKPVQILAVIGAILIEVGTLAALVDEAVGVKDGTVLQAASAMATKAWEKGASDYKQMLAERIGVLQSDDAATDSN